MSHIETVQLIRILKAENAKSYFWICKVARLRGCDCLQNIVDLNASSMREMDLVARLVFKYFRHRRRMMTVVEYVAFRRVYFNYMRSRNHLSNPDFYRMKSDGVELINQLIKPVIWSNLPRC